MKIIFCRKVLSGTLLCSLVLWAVAFTINRQTKQDSSADEGFTKPHRSPTLDTTAEERISRTSSLRKSTLPLLHEPSMNIVKSYEEIARDLALEDFDKALLFIDNVPLEKQNEYITGLLFIGAKHHFEKLYKFLNKNNSKLENRDKLILTLLTFAARNNPEGVVDLLKANDKADSVEEFDLILKGYFGSGIHRDFNTLTESLNLLVDNNDRNRAFQATVKQVGPVELDEFIHNINASNEYAFISSESYFVLIERLLRALDPRQAESFIPKIQEERTKIKALKLIENFKLANGIK